MNGRAKSKDRRVRKKLKKKRITDTREPPKRKRNCQPMSIAAQNISSKTTNNAITGSTRNY
jgi:hypothetical protein